MSMNRVEIINNVVRINISFSFVFESLTLKLLQDIKAALV